MPSEECRQKCSALIEKLETNTYFSAALPALNQKWNEIKDGLINKGTTEAEAQKQAYKLVLSHLHDVMRGAESLVEIKINDRINRGEIQDASQARKSAAGNIFQQMIAYVLAKNVLLGNISKNVIVTTSTKNLIEEYAAIRVGDDIQKPDSDILVYSPDANTPIMNLSCKTSCRERAGQTYKWKLLCDLATCNCDHKDDNLNCPATKYGLAYTATKKILVCFITADFYNELTNPQIAAMFHFFDFSYVAKETCVPNIAALNRIIDDINSVF